MIIYKVLHPSIDASRTVEVAVTMNRDDADLIANELGPAAKVVPVMTVNYDEWTERWNSR